jgi:hypothetical protein
LALALLLRTPPRRPFRVEQVTYSGHVLANDLDVESFSSSASDGTRLYFSHMEAGNPVLAVALAANGEVSHFHLPSEIAAPLIGSLSPDGSRLIIHSHLQADPEQPLWIVPTLGGECSPRSQRPRPRCHLDARRPPPAHRQWNELTVVGADGSDPISLVTTPLWHSGCAGRPMGKRLRFTLRDSSARPRNCGRWQADGSNLHPLLPGWSQPASECCGSWTPDGRDFVFQSSHNGHSDIWARRERPWPSPTASPGKSPMAPSITRRPALRRMATASTLLESISRLSCCALCPTPPHLSLDQNLSAAALAEYSEDGQWVAWLNASDGSLWRSRIDGSERIELTTPPLRIFSMKWSPDNRTPGHDGQEPGMPWKIYLLDSEGGKLTPALNEDRNEADPGLVVRRSVDRLWPAARPHGQPPAQGNLSLESANAQGH